MVTDEEKPVAATRGEATAEAVAIALNAVPSVGGVLAGIANSVIQRRQNQRLNDFLVQLADDLKAVQSRVNSEFVRSEEFQNLAEHVFSEIAETRQKEKIDALRAIFLNTVLSTRPSYDEAEEIVKLVSSWQPRHLVLLKILDDPIRADREVGQCVGEGGGFATSLSQILGRLLPEWGDDQIERTWEELRDSRIHSTRGTRTMMTDRGIHQVEGRLSEFGRRVAGYVRVPSV